MKLSDKIQKILDSDISAYSIGKITGVGNSSILEMRKGNRKVENMRLGIAEKLGDFYDKEIAEETAKMNKLNETIKEIQNEIDNKRQGDYLNVGRSHNQIVNANVFNKSDYEDFYFNQKDSWVEGGHMINPSDVRNNDIVISYYNDSDVENSFVVEDVSYIEPEQIALNDLALDVINFESNK